MPIKKHVRGLMDQYSTGERKNFWGDGHYKFMLEEKSQLTKLKDMQVKLRKTVRNLYKSTSVYNFNCD